MTKNGAMSRRCSTGSSQKSKYVKMMLPPEAPELLDNYNRRRMDGGRRANNREGCEGGMRKGYPNTLILEVGVGQET